MKDTARKVIAKAGPFLGLVVVIVLFALPAETRDIFLSYHNFKTIFTQTVIVAIGAIGMTMIIISGGIDLSVGSTIALSGVVTALTANAGFDPFVAIIAGVSIGALVGFVNGLVITLLRVVPFIETLGMLGI